MSANHASQPDDYKETLKGWKSALERFRCNIYPTFEPFGFSIAEAFLAFKLNELQNQLDEHRDLDEEDDEPWKRKS